MDLFEEFKNDSSIAKGSSSSFSAMTGGGDPIFNFKKLDWEKSSSKLSKKFKTRVIYHVACCNNVLVIATNGCSILRWNLLEGSKEPEEIEISPKADDAIEQLFIDPTGHHVFISLKNADNYYLHSRSLRPKKLSKLQGVVECVAFDKLYGTESFTKSFLVGTSQGVIYEMAVDSSGKEKCCQVVYHLDTPIAITSIYFEGSTGENGVDDGGSGGGGGGGGGNGYEGQDSSSSGSSRLFVMCATTSPTRLYHFIGGPTFQQLFAEYSADKHYSSSYTELPGEIKRAELHCYSKTPNGQVRSFAMMTEMGIYHGSLLFTNSTGAGSENVLLEAQLIPFVTSADFKSAGIAGSSSSSSLSYGASSNNNRSVEDNNINGSRDRFLDKPVSIAVTEFHFLTLRGDRLQVMSRLNGLPVQEELLRPGEGVALGLVRDSVRNVHWLVTSTTISQITSQSEDRNVWSIFLSKAQASGDEKLYEQAYEYTKTKEQKKQVLRARADLNYFQLKQFDKAALFYAKSDASFDETVLKLMHIDGSAGGGGGSGGGSAATSSSSSNANLPASSGVGSFQPITSSSYIAPRLDAMNTTDTSNSTGTAINAELRAKIVTSGTDLSALRIYLVEVLKQLPNTAKSQRTMLCTWLSEVYLHQIAIASLGAQAPTAAASAAAATAAITSTGSSGGGTTTRGRAPLSAEAKACAATESELIAQFKDFLRVNKSVLDLATTLNLIISRNNRAMLLFFTQIVGDYHKVVRVFLSEQRYSDAIRVLTDAPFEKVGELIYKTAPLLIITDPEATLQMLLSKPQLNVALLLPALLHYVSALDVQNAKIEAGHVLNGSEVDLGHDFEGKSVNFAIKYLQECLERCGLGFEREVTPHEVGSSSGTTGDTLPEPILLHTLLWLLAKYDDSPFEENLVVILQHLCDLSSGGHLVGYQLDVDYIIRQCRRYERPRSALMCLLLMGDALGAVTEALHLDLQLAKGIASKQESPQLRKQLWLCIAKHFINTESDMRKPIALIKESGNILSIDDLLPFLPDFTEIDLFKDEICQTLASCSERIDYLRGEMDELADSAESTMKELDSMKNRAYSTVSQFQTCEYCGDAVTGRQFYLFPCSHGFHSNCLLKKAAQHLEPAQLSAVRGIEDMLCQPSLAAVVRSQQKNGGAGRGNESQSDARARAQVEALQLELDGYIAADCPLCGYVMIRSLSVPLITAEDSEEAKAWAL